MLTEASSTISDLRIAARRGEPAELVDIAGPLEDLSSRLSGFEQDHEAG